MIDWQSLLIEIKINQFGGLQSLNIFQLGNPQPSVSSQVRVGSDMFPFKRLVSDRWIFHNGCYYWQLLLCCWFWKTIYYTLILFKFLRHFFLCPLNVWEDLKIVLHVLQGYSRPSMCLSACSLTWFFVVLWPQLVQ